MLSHCLILIIATCRPPAQTAASPLIAVRATPANPYIESVGSIHHLSFDFIVTNRSDRPTDLTSVRLMAYDRAGTLVLRRFTENGLSASLQSAATVTPRSTILLLNPFATFPADLPLDRLDFEFVFNDKEGGAERSLRLPVRPRP